ncbi:MAG: Nif11-like leader peptide family RiPP precursor [Chitinispirillales bacterium]|jgi:predicted ribosomally synthesized peptide with nif11-like leader|nr:Nif11-like leader peptide family RiPP precursor [Chitinispirillales bacterium]
MGLTEFLEKMGQDAAFAEKYAKLDGLEAMFAEAKNDGYDVSRADVEHMVKEKAAKGELSDEQLFAIVGGYNRYLGPLPCRPGTPCWV